MALAVLGAILAITASPASALKWTGNSNTWSGSLTFTKEGGKFPSKCTFSNQALYHPGGLTLENEWTFGGWVASGSCSEGGAVSWFPQFNYENEISAGEYAFWFADTLPEAHSSPWSGKEWWGDLSGGGSVTLMNGNGIEHSRFVLNGTYVNFVEGGNNQALATGTLTADGTQRLE